MTNKVKPSKAKDKIKSSKDKDKGKSVKTKGNMKKRGNAFKVVDEAQEKPETDEDFHKKLSQEMSKKSKKKTKVAAPDPIKLLIDDDEDELDFGRGDAASDASEEDGDSADEGDYERFVEEVARLDGRKQKVTGARTEGTGEVAEYNLAAGRGSKVGVAGLLSALGSNETDVRSLARRLKQGDQQELAVPLERPASERVARLAGYAGVKREVAVWDAVVHSRRAADQVTFPLLKPDLKLQGASETIKTRFTAATPLEQQIAAVLARSQAVVREGEELSEIEKRGLEGLTAKEAADRKAELAKIRALQTYQEARFRRQGKIKSKKYRKIARKEREKEKLQELELLQNTDPEAAREKLEEMEKMRIDERASLKHRNASKYLQLQAKRAKFDKNSKTILNDELSKHREMLTKHGEQFDDTYEQDEETAVDTDDLDLSKVPKGEETFEEFSSKARKFYTDEQEKKRAVTEELDVAFENAEFGLKQSNKKDIAALKRRLDGTVVEEVEEATEGDADGGEGLVQADSLNFKVRPDSDQQIAGLASDLGKELQEKETLAVLPSVDPANFLEPTRILGQDLPEIVGYNEQDEEDPSQMDLIAEAFADDDVVESFRTEKEARVAASKPASIDLTLPGWGEWGGGGARPSRRKRKRFTVKAPPAPKRRDENNKILIINTEKDEKIRSHQVSNIPFPFTSVSDFEASVRAPVGATFVPRTAHLKMIKPRVVTRAGTVIEPMARDQLVRRGIENEEGKRLK